MKLNGKDYYSGMGDYKRYSSPLLEKGNFISLPVDDETTPLPGCKRMKRGEYQVLTVRKSLFGMGYVYELLKNVANAKHPFCICTVAIDKAILNNAIKQTL